MTESALLVSTKIPHESQCKPFADHILSEHLSYIINEGLLDSVLPYIHAISGPLHSSMKGTIQHICGSKSKLNNLQPKLFSPKAPNTHTNENFLNIKTPNDTNASSSTTGQSQKKLNQFSDHLSKYTVHIILLLYSSMGYICLLLWSVHNFF